MEDEWDVNYTRPQRPALGLMLLRTALAVSSFSKKNKRKKARARAKPSPARARAVRLRDLLLSCVRERFDYTRDPFLTTLSYAL